MSCSAADTTGCLDLRCRAFPLRGQVSAEWCTYLGSMARRARDSVASLRRSSAGWMPARIGRLSAGSSHKPRGVIQTRSMRRVRALWHQSGAQNFAVEWTRFKVAVRNIVSPARDSKPPQECDTWCQLFVKWFEVICERPAVLRYSEVFGLRANGQSFVAEVGFQLTFSFLVVEMEDCRRRFYSAEL